MPIEERLKTPLLLEMLDRGDIRTALVFTRTKHRANRLAEKLSRAGVRCDRIHGNRSQKQRQAALTAFKNGRIQVLVATDIAARGIDVDALPHVVNFDVPGQPEDYIHRVGRTARRGTTGDAVTFVSPAERSQLGAIERAVGHQIPRRQLKGFDHTAKPEELGGRGAPGPRPANRRPNGGPRRNPGAPPRNRRSQKGRRGAHRA